MKFLFKYILISVFIISISVCCKKKEVKIVGSWKYEYLSSVDTNKVQIWSFNEDKSIIKSLDTLKPDTGTWSIKSDLLSGSMLKISSMDDHFDGTYEILTLNKKYLILQRVLLSNGVSAGAFLRAEFIKK